MDKPLHERVRDRADKRRERPAWLSVEPVKRPSFDPERIKAFLRVERARLVDIVADLSRPYDERKACADDIAEIDRGTVPRRARSRLRSFRF